MDKVWELFDKERLYECYECARCTGSCPAAIVMNSAGPRKLLLKCLQQGKRAVIQDQTLWYCTTCRVCEDRCPQEINIHDLLIGLMNFAALRQNVPDKVKFTVEKIAKTGRSFIGYRVDRERERYGLPPLKEVDMEEISLILNHTGLFKDLGV